MAFYRCYGSVVRRTRHDDNEILRTRPFLVHVQFTSVDYIFFSLLDRQSFDQNLLLEDETKIMERREVRMSKRPVYTALNPPSRFNTVLLAY